jgi:hypothetical protein
MKADHFHHYFVDPIDPIDSVVLAVPIDSTNLAILAGSVVLVDSIGLAIPIDSANLAILAGSVDFVGLVDPTDLADSIAGFYQLLVSLLVEAPIYQNLDHYMHQISIPMFHE